MQIYDNNPTLPIFFLILTQEDGDTYIDSPAYLYRFPSIFHFLSQHRAEYHLYVLAERIMLIIIPIDTYLVGVNHLVVILHGNILRRTMVSLQLPLGYII